MDRKTLDRLQDKTIEELKALEQEKRKKIATLRLEKRVGRLKNVRELKSVRHDLARILTVLGEKTLRENLLSQPTGITDKQKRRNLK